MQGDYFILCTKASCQHFSPPRRNFFHHKSYSFLSRTVRLTNSNPKSLLLGCRGTLAQNRGTMGVQIPFSFPKSLAFKPLQTKVRILPWHTNSISPYPLLKKSGLWNPPEAVLLSSHLFDFKILFYPSHKYSSRNSLHPGSGNPRPYQDLRIQSYRKPRSASPGSR